MGLECRQEKITLQGKAGDEVGPGLGYREVKRWGRRRRSTESLGSWLELSVLAEGTSHVVSTLRDSQHSPPAPHFPLVPFLFIQTPDPREPPHWAVTPGAGSILGGTPLPRGEEGMRPHIPPTSGEAEILKWLTDHSQLGRKDNAWDGSK